MTLVDPRTFVDPTRGLMPFTVRQFLGLMRVAEFLRLSPERDGDTQPVAGRGQPLA
jgi:hypothetical protein